MAKILKKWNYAKHEYEPYEVPDDWKVLSLAFDMDEMVVCPHCGKTLPFGDAYTSMEIHTDMGFGYAVCESCYNEEWKRRKSEQCQEKKNE